jgi:hypothetical protein
VERSRVMGFLRPKKRRCATKGTER